MNELSRKGILFCLVGPAGSGKSSLALQLLEGCRPGLQPSISVTSRSSRSGEIDGEHYHFVARVEFQRMIDAGELFEFEETHGEYYGTLRSVVDAAIQSGTDLLLDVDIRGALTFADRYPDNAVVVFLIAPSFEELDRRVRARSSVTEEELQRRYRTAVREYDTFLKNVRGRDRDTPQIEYVVVNTDFQEAFELVSAILRAERARARRLAVVELERMCEVPGEALGKKGDSSC